MTQFINLDELVDVINEEETKRQEKPTRGASDDRFLVLQPGNTILVRFLPNMHNKAKTFTPYEEYGFKSINGQYIYAGQTPHSVGKKDIVREFQWNIYKAAKDRKDEAAMKRSYMLFGQSKEMVNVYVISDQLNPENNGKVKVLRYSAKVNKDKEPTSPIYSKIRDSIFSKDSPIGKLAFDLSASGVNFSIKVTKNAGDWNDYSKSEFKWPSDLGLSDAQIAEILENTYDLESLIPALKSDEELKQLLDVHWYGNTSPSENDEVSLSDDNDDELPMFNSKSATPEVDDMDAFINDLDSLEND